MLLNLLLIVTASSKVIVPKTRLNLFRSNTSLKSFSSPMTDLVEYWTKKDVEHEYLKEVLGEKALDWVKGRNTHSIESLEDPKSSPMYDTILSILDSKDKIPEVSKIYGMYYNFWKDAVNPRGVWRRTTLDSYRTAQPDWETVLNLDDLGAAEGQSWVYKGSNVYKPLGWKKGDPKRCLLSLSPGGSDACVIREFDLESLQFVTPEGDGKGFVLPEGKSVTSWKSLDLLLIGTDLKDGKSVTDSGYPRVVLEWKRGTPVEESVQVYEGEKTDVSVSGYMSRHRDKIYEIRRRSITFYTAKMSIRVDGEWHDLDQLPLDAQPMQFANQFLIKLRSDWIIKDKESGKDVTLSQGSLVAVGIEDFIANGISAVFRVLFEPSAGCSLEDYTPTKNYLIIESLEKVKSRFSFWKLDDVPPSPSPSSVPSPTSLWSYAGTEDAAAIRGGWSAPVDSHNSDEYWLTRNTFLQPSSLFLADASVGPPGLEGAELLKSMPSQFDSTGLVEEQYEATSEDGTKVPYFIVRHKDMPMDGTTPTLLYGYGGFEISLTPVYSAVVGSSWLNYQTNGYYSCYVMANIRGGGEFGPQWHQAALRENRKLAYDDFIAVGEDLVQRKITSPTHLGIRGGSNGGLLMGNMITRRPDLFGAVCCAVPLLDMKCYHTLLAGASWQGEYGYPDIPDDWKFLQKYSAYHNIDPTSAAVSYPPLLMTTSTRDDRVHPYHARSFVKRLLDVAEKKGVDGGDRVFYYENIEGGHGGAADNKQMAFMNVLYIRFLQKTIVKM